MTENNSMQLTSIALPVPELKALDIINGYEVRPGFYEQNGATALSNSCVNFTVQSRSATSCELLLFHKGSQEPFAVIPFPEHYRIGNVYSMIVFGLKIEEFEYAYRMDGPYDPKKGLIFDKTRILLDPYAKAVAGQSDWGMSSNQKGYRGRVVRNNFDWGTEKQSFIPMNDLIIYELHVRGFTMDESSGVTYPGTFSGLREKIPYLKDLGVNAVELMPIFEFDETRDKRTVNGKQLLDYWGYNSVSFFAPNTSYNSNREYNREGTKLKELIRDLKTNGIEVILDVVFNHTAEGNERGPYISFKGFDNNIYYMLTPDGHYYNFSGCGNTLNCNHPVVQQMILECLRYWVTDYRIDGFRFDLATILGRNEDGSPMNNPPLLKQLAFDPILGSTKLIAEAWDAGGLYQVGSFPSWNRWAEWNGKYRDCLRNYLKGDIWAAPEAVLRIIGSPDLYGTYGEEHNSSVNFITCHDGFPLYDLYAYNQKHNEENGWNNTDGSDDNRSWNCGVEGETDDPQIIGLRKKMIKNACAVLLCSRGTPMFLAGDEFGNTQFGNNNAYCQDNIISWLDWSLLEKNHDIYRFFKYMIAFRKDHPIIRNDLEPSGTGYDFISIHNGAPDFSETNENTRTLGILYTGYNREKREEDIVYFCINAYWEPCTIYLPILPEGYSWNLMVDTGISNEKELFFDVSDCPGVENEFLMKDRSVAIFTGRSKR
ncbi:alpha-amylase family glycosyl hydrolase [Lachnospiraceae bacterium JLR.KK008]